MPDVMASPRRRVRGALVVASALVGAGLIASVSLFLTSRQASPEVRTGEPMLVWAEFGAAEDRIYLARPERLDERTLVDAVAHAPGWGINPASEVAGSHIAYTVLPAGAPPERDAPAELWLVDLETREKTRLAGDADLLVTPVFVDGGRGLVYRRSEGARQELVQLDLASLTRMTLHEERTSFGIFPVGLAANGAFVFARLSAEGTDLYRTRRTGDPEYLVHLSDDIARDFRLSPDGEAMSYLAPEFEAERVAYRAQARSLDDGGGLPLPKPADDAGEQYSPVWTPNGAGLTVGQEAREQAAEPAIVLGTDGSVEALPAPDQGFDVPLGWSDNGRFLAVRSFDGRNSTQPGSEATVVVDAEGGRYALDAPTEVIYIGWYSVA